MRPRSIIFESTRLIGGATCDGLHDDSTGPLAIPLLCGKRIGAKKREAKDHGEETEHHRQISIRSWIAATAIVTAVAGCGDALVPGGGTVDEADLVPLALQASAPPVPATNFYVRTNTVTIRALRHGDAVNSLYVELRFPAGSLVSVDGTPIASGDSVLVSVNPRPGAYGFRLSPAGLAFSESTPPTATFSFARYGDLSVADAEPAFSDRATYAAALDVWEEIALRRWRVATASAGSGVSEISAAVEGGGEYILAAQR